MHKAVWSISGTTKELAIKTLKPGSKEEEKLKVLQEAAIMGQFFHPNVVRLYGVVTVGEPVSDIKYHLAVIIHVVLTQFMLSCFMLLAC